MKLRLTKSLYAAVVLCGALADAATYNTLGGLVKDADNGVYYNGAGFFAVESARATEISVTIDLNSLDSYLASNDYTPGKAVLWNYTGGTCNSYGLADNSSYFTGYWNNQEWNTKGNISHDTLKTYAVDGLVTLTLTSNPTKDQTTSGIQVTATNPSTKETVNLYEGTTLLDSGVQTTTGYWVNTNYITSVTINTPSTLDVSAYEEPKDYTSAFVNERTDGTSVGRIMFQGDSITHGVNDASWRWQLFKTLTDNGIENEIVGPRSGYFSTPITSDAATNESVSYGGAEFANVHLAQASGRTHNIISGSNAGSGVNYGGNSTASASDTFNCNTYVCLMGTNDLLSDSGSTTADFCRKMQNMVGGTVSYDNGYTWTEGTNWGNIGKIVTDSLRDEGDTIYIMSVPTWGRHANSNAENFHSAVEQYNAILKQWVETFNARNEGKNIIWVDSNRGLVDLTNSTTFTGNDAFFNSPGRDGLHPNEQGSLILAGNLARAMGIGGRTGGLRRSATTDEGWTSITTPIELSAGETHRVENAEFSVEKGYTVDFNYNVGDGSANGWASSDNSLNITIADGARGSQLKLTEGYIMWGGKVLFCQDNHLENNENIRVAWIAGDSDNNVQEGYYVWLGDMLIGQGLSATATKDNGLNLSTTDLSATIGSLSYADTAYAPSTTLKYSQNNAFISKGNPMTDHDSDKPVTSGIDFSGAETVTVNGKCAITGAGSDEQITLQLSNNNGWFGVVSSKCTGDIAAKVADGVTSGASLFGIMNGGSAKSLTMVVDKATLNDGAYSGQTGAIIGAFNGATADLLKVEVNSGEVKGDIVGGAINGNCDFKEVNLTINQGAVSGSVYGGSKSSGGLVGNVSITITGGFISGNVQGGGTNGSVTGKADILITGGVIKGRVDASANGTSGKVGSTSTVRIEGNKASLSGDIIADTVTLVDVSATEYTNAFDSYNGTIHAEKLVLDHVTTELKAQLADNIGELHLCNNSEVIITLSETKNLNSLFISEGSSLSAYYTGTSFSESAESILSITESAVFGAEAKLYAHLILNNGATLSVGDGGLFMGSAVTLGSGLTLGNSVDYGQTYTLFTDTESFIANGKLLANGEIIDAASVFNGIEGNLRYKDGSVTLMVTPEPASATLSLLALAALAARRRRK